MSRTAEFPGATFSGASFDRAQDWDAAAFAVAKALRPTFDHRLVEMSGQKRKNPLTGKNSKVVETPYSKDGWRIVECEETGMVYLENPPDYSRLAQEFAWEKTYEEERARRKVDEPLWSRLSSVGKGLRQLVRSRERVEAEVEHAAVRISKRRSSGSVLRIVDVGCGDADKLERVALSLTAKYNLMVEPIGIEVSKQLARTSRERLVPLGGDCFNLNAIEGVSGLEDESAEVMILCSFLEHESQPLELLESARCKLRLDGSLVIKVPNYGSFNRRIRQGKWCGFRYPDHVNYFTPGTLRDMIERAGLVVQRMGWQDTLPTSDNMWAIVGRSSEGRK